jgi:hypothetical protein
MLGRDLVGRAIARLDVSPSAGHLVTQPESAQPDNLDTAAVGAEVRAAGSHKNPVGDRDAALAVRAERPAYGGTHPAAGVGEHLMREITLTQTSSSQATTQPGVLHPPGSTWARRGLVGGLASAAAIAAITVAATLSGPGTAAAAAFSFEKVSNDAVAVHIVDTTAEADAMTEQLHEQGLNVTIDAVAAGPQLIGTWLTASFSGDVPETVVQQVLQQVPNGYTPTVELPTSFDGDIRLAIGRAPAAGESPQVMGMRNALAPGARLGCLHATGGNPQDVRQAVEKLGYTVTWASGEQMDLATVSAPGTGQLVTSAFIDDAAPSSVQVVVTTPGSQRYDAQSHRGYSPTQWDNRASNPGSCTPA